MPVPALTTIGLIADTHGLLRPEALRALAGSDHILHAGDIGDPAILIELNRIAPVTAIRGNIDRATWAQALPSTEVLQIAHGTYIYMLHDLATLDLDPAAAGFQVVVHGHSHRPGIGTRDGVLTINPGSAGPRRFALPISVGRLAVQAGTVTPTLIDLAVPGRASTRRA